jgi:glycosyltransferase involved in cell wall biosynthesis
VDFGKVGNMKIIQILPELEEGGAERHVLWLSNEFARKGHKVMVISAGGKLVSDFEPSVVHWKLPVHLKNPLTAAYCAVKIATRAVREGWEVLHAHSRVPVWIAWWASCLSGIPWVFTAHDRYKKNYAIYPFRYAKAAICVSNSVCSHLEGFLPDRAHVVYNGLPKDYGKWQKKDGELPMRFLFLGRLTRRKGFDVALKALGELKDYSWELDVVGDGTFRTVLESISRELGIEKRVHFHGFRDDTEEWMKRCDCLLFPSLDEGMGLVLMQAVYMGVPVLASDIAPVRELAVGDGNLVPPGDVEAWRKRIKIVLEKEEVFSYFDAKKVFTVKEAALRIEKVYTEVFKNEQKSGKGA